MRIHQKTAIVTSGESGLCPVIAPRLAAEGATAAVPDPIANTSRAVVEEIHAADGSATAHEFDVTNHSPIGTDMNCVAPGFFLTRLTTEVRSHEDVAKQIGVRVRQCF